MAGSASVSLPVLSGGGGVRPSRSAPRRAAVLIAVHVLFAIHLAWWWLRGDTLTPVEPSEAMQTLELGLVNAGFVFFVSAMLLQLVFGRFVCGWACHVVAVQDLCAWLLKKAGIRPHPFRSRLLMLAPLVLALYMFVWPTLKREVVCPLAERLWPAALEVLGRPGVFPAQGFTFHFITDDFWATFAPVAVAIPFMLVCGGLCVYFLGAKGFCTYGCPYGGFFTPLDRFSVGRIIVDPAKCEGCGHCTAVCTSNVRVHEEIKVHGMVVDPGCMKCLDCVSVCPNTALSWSFAAPAALKKAARPRRRFDLTWGQELGLAAVFFGTFWSVRGAYELFPILFAMGIAGCVTFLAWKLWGMAGRGDVRMGGWQLKRAGKVGAGGVVFAAGMVVLLGLVAHTGVVTYHRVMGDRFYESVSADKESLLNPGSVPVPAERVELARRALGHYARADSWRRGGIGLAGNLLNDRNAALLHLVTGDHASCEAALRRIARGAGEQDELTNDIARVMVLQGRDDDARAFVDDALRRRPEFWGVRERRAAGWIAQGRAEAALRDALEALPRIGGTWEYRVARARTRLIAAWALGVLGRGEEALAQMKLAAGDAPGHARARAALARGYAQLAGDLGSAVSELREAVKLEPGSAENRFFLGQLLLGTGDIDGALDSFERALTVSRGDPRLRDAVAQVLAQSGQRERSEAWNRRHPPATER